MQTDWTVLILQIYCSKLLYMYVETKANETSSFYQLVTTVKFEIFKDELAELSKEDINNVNYS